MLASMALILLCGLLLNRICINLKIPGVLGMLLTGILLGPYALDLIDPSILQISGDLREFALIVILLRAGLALDVKDLKQVGRPAILLSFVPALLEITGVILLAPLLFDISLIDAALLGSVIAAVSPAIIVPRMLHLMKEGYGAKKKIPHLIMAGATVDDIFVIVLFTSFLQGASGGELTLTTLITIPLSIAGGLIVGVIVGILLFQLFKLTKPRDTVKIIIILSTATLLVALENITRGVPYSGLIATMTVGGAILKQSTTMADRLSCKFEKLWVIAQIILFVLVGAEVQLSYAVQGGLPIIGLITGVLFFRILGVFISLIHTPLSKSERLFCAYSYIPKATVQAAIGAIPLSLGLASGQLIITAAVLAICITAPLGAICMDRSYKRLLNLDNS